jgi:hypothetical protein
MKDIHTGDKQFVGINGYKEMGNYKLTIKIGDQSHHFEVGEYLHHSGNTCRIRIFENGEFVAGFQLDGNHFLHLCQNPAGLEESVLHMIADHLEANFPFGGKHYKA